MVFEMLVVLDTLERLVNCVNEDVQDHVGCDARSTSQRHRKPDT